LRATWALSRNSSYALDTIQNVIHSLLFGVPVPNARRVVGWEAGKTRGSGRLIRRALEISRPAGIAHDHWPEITGKAYLCKAADR
jgi:hypothetical protein